MYQGLRLFSTKYVKIVTLKWQRQLLFRTTVLGPKVSLLSGYGGFNMMPKPPSKFSEFSGERKLAWQF